MTLPTSQDLEVWRPRDAPQPPRPHDGRCPGSPTGPRFRILARYRSAAVIHSWLVKRPVVASHQDRGSWWTFTFRRKATGTQCCANPMITALNARCFPSRATAETISPKLPAKICDLDRLRSPQIRPHLWDQGRRRRYSPPDHGYFSKSRLPRFAILTDCGHGNPLADANRRLVTKYRRKSTAKPSDRRLNPRSQQQ